MAGITIRNEYYWDPEMEKVVGLPHHRPSGWGPWNTRNEDNLVVAVERHGHRMELKDGPSCTEERRAQALMLEHGLVPNAALRDEDMHVPPELVRELEDRIERAEQRTRSKLGNLSGEDQATTMLFQDIAAQYEVAGWKVKLTAQHHSAQLEEPHTGADIGVIVDVSAPNGARAVKALWLQAKLRIKLPKDVEALPRMKEQRAKMAEYTKHAYAIVYTSESIRVYGPGREQEQLSTGQLFADAVRCQRGDRDRWVLVNTFGAQHFLRIDVGPIARNRGRRREGTR